MSVRSIVQGSGVGDLINYGLHAGVKVDTDDHKLKFKDDGGTARVVVSEDQVQTLTNKTLTSPVLNAPVVTPAAPTAIAADGAITIASGTVKITKAGSACLLTLAAPTAGQEGTKLVIISDSAFAHVITATGLINDGVTGGAKTTATFAAFAGAAITLEAINLKWAVVSKNVVTIT